jgi:uncharacterized protein (TIGR01370 family)
MRNPASLLLILLLCCISCSEYIRLGTWIQQFRGNHRWAIYYDSKVPAETFAGYDLVVFDRIYYSEFSVLSGKTVVLAYVSAGEIHDTAPEKPLLEQENAIFPPKNKWGSWAVDLTCERWRNIVLSHVDDAMQKGFDGVMLDTIDSPLHASAATSPELAAGNRKAVVTLIEDIRSRYPDIKIMLNRGFEILPKVADKIDYALAESILTELNISAGQSHLNPSDSYQQATDMLLWARSLSPTIQIYTLDYWNLDDVDGVKRIYQIQRSQGFRPYVTTPDLRRFTPEPV